MQFSNESKISIVVTRSGRLLISDKPTWQSFRLDNQLHRIKGSPGCAVFSEHDAERMLSKRYAPLNRKAVSLKGYAVGRALPALNSLAPVER